MTKTSDPTFDHLALEARRAEDVKSTNAVESYWRAWTERSLDNILSLLAPEFVSRSPLSQGQPVNKDMFAAGFKAFGQALPDLRENIVSIVAKDGVVACVVEETATFAASMTLPTGVIEPTNRSYTMRVGAFFIVTAHGLIVEQQIFRDTAAWAHQIGIDPRLLFPVATAATLA